MLCLYTADGCNLISQIRDVDQGIKEGGGGGGGGGGLKRNLALSLESTLPGVDPHTSILPLNLTCDCSSIKSLITNCQLFGHSCTK